MAKGTKGPGVDEHPGIIGQEGDLIDGSAIIRSYKLKVVSSIHLIFSSFHSLILYNF
jgi:hypothetical protein